MAVVVVVMGIGRVVVVVTATVGMLVVYWADFLDSRWFRRHWRYWQNLVVVSWYKVLIVYGSESEDGGGFVQYWMVMVLVVVKTF